MRGDASFALNCPQRQHEQMVLDLGDEEAGRVQNYFGVRLLPYVIASKQPDFLIFRRRCACALSCVTAWRLVLWRGV